MIKKIEQAVAYVKTCLDQKGTWLAIGVGVTGAAALSSPWNIIFILTALVGALVPTP